MTKGDEPVDSEGKPEKICAFKNCNQRLGLKKSKTGNWYCYIHHPKSRDAAKKNSSAGGKKATVTHRMARDLKLLNLEVAPNKASILKAFVDMANVLGKNVAPAQTRKVALLVQILDRIHDYATEEGDDSMREARTAAILESDLPDPIKLSKLVDIVGPQKATEMIKLSVEREAYDGETLDGEKLIQEQANGVAGSTISVPDAFKHIGEDTSQSIPTLDLEPPGAPQSVAPAAPPSGMIEAASEGPKGEIQAAAPAPAPAVPATPAPAPSLSPKDQEQQKQKDLERQAKEIVGLYRQKAIGASTPLDQTYRAFYDALAQGVPFRDLQQRVMFLRSDTEPPNMVVQDLKEKLAKRKTAS